MKKFFTLIAVALVAVSASAQDYKDLGEQITNGKIAWNNLCKDGDFSKYPASKLTCFVTGDWATGERVEGTARVVVDPDDKDAFDQAVADESGFATLNYCLEVVTRDAPQAKDDDGNLKFEEDGVTPVYESLSAWDARLFVVLPIELKEGDKVTYSMDVKAENPVINGVNFTTSWETFSTSFTVSAAQEGTTTFAFDLGGGANKLYFDNISVKVEQLIVSTEDAEKPAEPTGYVIYENRATDLSTLSVKYFKNYTDAAQIKDGNIVVTSLDADVSYADKYTDGTAGSEVKLTNNWDTQFLITLPYEFQGGDKFHLYFGYKADETANAETQCHYAAPAPGAIEGVDGYAGSYIYYSLAGSVKFTPYWNWFDADVTVPNDGAGMQAICFNLNVLKKSINYYFKDIIVTVDENDVPTFITEAKAKKASKSIFNAAGQQMKSLQKGLNIVDGQKVYVK